MKLFWKAWRDVFMRASDWSYGAARFGARRYMRLGAGERPRGGGGA